ncbi:pyocin S6 family toxin immunity protein [Pseudomonas chlororaphis]|uniref:pyocin S6 family toxin immunity protein n=1 Tax=Pseudomonas chlororaphis TaxID=587753 RepID=UPI00046E6F07|nr:pyocin S6 family toxin immunity protein [Pseudomonas chlororaphis]
MYLCLTGFLPEDDEDDSLKYQLKVSSEFERQIVSLLGHKSLNAMASGEWLLTAEQAQQIAALINESIPDDLDIFIGVEASGEGMVKAHEVEL